MSHQKLTLKDLRIPKQVNEGGRLLKPQRWSEDFISEEHQIDVKGESFHQPELDQIGALTQGGTFPIWLRPEPKNPHDSNALRVMVGATPIGYVAATEAQAWSAIALPLLQSGLFMTGEGWGVDTNPTFKGRRGALAKVFYFKPR